MRIEIIIERSLVKSKKVNSGELEALDHGNAALWNQQKLTGMQQRSNTQHDDIVGLRVQHLRTHNAHQRLAASECWFANFETPWFFPLRKNVRPFNVEPLSTNTRFSQSLSLSLSLVVSLSVCTRTHAHRVHPAVTRLTVYRRLYVM